MVAILERLCARHRNDPVRAHALVHASLPMGIDAAPFVLKALQDHRSTPAIPRLAAMMVESLPAEEMVIEQFAELLLNREVWHRSGIHISVTDQLVAGIRPENAARRVQLLAWKLRSVRDDEDSRRWFEYEREGSIENWADKLRPDRFRELLQGLAGALRASAPFVAIEDLLEIVDPLEGPLRSRVRAFLFANTPEVHPELAVAEVAAAIPVRLPTGDDLALIDRLVASDHLDAACEAWRESLGVAPPVVEVAERLRDDDIPHEWVIAVEWIGILPEQTTVGWTGQVAVLSTRYGRPSRVDLQAGSREGMLLSGQTPISVAELADVPVLEAADRIAAWRPSATQKMASARELGRTLEEAVKATPAQWVESPLQVATRLRHPTYIDHYLTAVAHAIGVGVVPPVGEIMDVIEVVHASPWSAVVLGHDDFDYDPDWRQSEQSTIEVIKALAEHSVGFAGRDDQVWAFLVAEVDEHGEPSGIDEDHDPLETAINRRCTRGLEAVLSFMAFEFREHGAARPAAFDLLERCLRLSGRDGAEHRAILSTRIGFLRYINAPWVDRIDSLMFGDEAPDGLAETTVDTTIKWSQPNRWVLEHHRALVRDAVVRGADRSIDWFIIAMLRAVPGYEPHDCVAFLRSASRLSAAGEMLGRILSETPPETELLDRATDFWSSAIAGGSPEDLHGFGWMAEVAELTDSSWGPLTLETLKVTGGRSDWSNAVAERASQMDDLDTALAIMDHLVRGEPDHWDLRRIIEHATHLIQRASELTGTPAHERLRTALLERGVQLPPAS